MMSENHKEIGVIGGGAWGTALACALAQKGHRVILWMRASEQAQNMTDSRENSRYLPGVLLPAALCPTAEMKDLRNCEVYFVVVPTQNLRTVMRQFKQVLSEKSLFVLCAKGIEQQSGLFPSQIFAEEYPQGVVSILSGPSFAHDVVRGLPTAVTLAAHDPVTAQELAHSISSKTFRVYHGTDVTGVEIGGAAKNVYAIGCGAIMGRGFGESAKAALIARSFAELLRFSAYLGGKSETLMGLSGLGDLLLTCNSSQSRNFSFGHQLGQKGFRQEGKNQKLAEGAFTAPVLAHLARKFSVEMPIAETIHALLAHEVTLDDAIESLLTRPVKPEHRTSAQ